MTDFERAWKAVDGLCLSTNMEQALRATMDAYLKKVRKATMPHNELRPRLICHVLNCAIEALETGKSAFEVTMLGHLDDKVSDALILLGLTWTEWNKEKRTKFTIRLDSEIR